MVSTKSDTLTTDGTCNNVLDDIRKRRELWSQAKQDVLDALSLLGKAIMLDNNDGKIDAAKMIIESIEDL